MRQKSVDRWCCNDEEWEAALHMRSNPVTRHVIVLCFMWSVRQAQHCNLFFHLTSMLWNRWSKRSTSAHPPTLTAYFSYLWRGAQHLHTSHKVFQIQRVPSSKKETVQADSFFSFLFFFHCIARFWKATLGKHRRCIILHCNSSSFCNAVRECTWKK